MSHPQLPGPPKVSTTRIVPWFADFFMSSRRVCGAGSSDRRQPAIKSTKESHGRTCARRRFDAFINRKLSHGKLTAHEIRHRSGDCGSRFETAPLPGSKLIVCRFPVSKFRLEEGAGCATTLGRRGRKQPDTDLDAEM